MTRRDSKRGIKGEAQRRRMASFAEVSVTAAPQVFGCQSQCTISFIHSFIRWRLLPPPGQVWVCSNGKKINVQ